MAFADDLAGGDVESREERGDAVTFVIRGAASGLAGGHRPDRPRASEGSPLRLLIATPPDGPLGWGQVEAADVTDVSDEEGVAGAVERSGYMGREF